MPVIANRDDINVDTRAFILTENDICHLNGGITS